MICVSSAKLVGKRKAAKTEQSKHQEEGVGAAGHQAVVEALRPWEAEAEAEARR